MTYTKQNHPFVLQFREEERHFIEYLFCSEFRMNESESALESIKNKCKEMIGKKFCMRYTARLLGMIVANEPLAKEYGELWKIK